MSPVTFFWKSKSLACRETCYKEGSFVKGREYIFLNHQYVFLKRFPQCKIDIEVLYMDLIRAGGIGFTDKGRQSYTNSRSRIKVRHFPTFLYSYIQVREILKKYDDKKIF